MRECAQVRAAPLPRGTLRCHVARGEKTGEIRSERAYPRGAEARGAVLTGAARAVVEGLAVAAGPAVRAGALQQNATSLFG